MRGNDSCGKGLNVSETLENKMWRLYSANYAYKNNQQIKNHVNTCMQKKTVY